MSHKFKGVGVALVTPFTSDGNIDFTSLTKLVELQLDGGTDFLVVQGTTGESPVLSQKEKMEDMHYCKYPKGFLGNFKRFFVEVGRTE